MKVLRFRCSHCGRYYIGRENAELCCGPHYEEEMVDKDYIEGRK